MRSTQLLLGICGLALTLLCWASQPMDLSASFAIMLLLCAIGGLQPIRIPGLAPLPLSLPLVGAVALTSDAAHATTAGLVAGLSTLLHPNTFARDGRDTKAELGAGLGLSGALALAAGLVAAGISPILRSPASSSSPANPTTAEELVALIALALTFIFAAATARAAGATEHSLQKGLHFTAASAMGVACVTLGLLATMTRFGEDGVQACLAAAGMTGAAAAIVIARGRARERSAERRAGTGLALLEAVALAVEAKDRASQCHLQRMRAVCAGIGRRLGMNTLDLEAIEYAAILHDIGKLVVPESILCKPALLSSEEFQRVAVHASVGADILETTALSSKVASMVRHHHERYDGSGYPDGLVGMEIPFGARVLAVADTYEALTSDRPYRRSVTAPEALVHLKREAGTLYDPRVVQALVDHCAEMGPHAEAGAPATPPTAERPAVQALLDRIASSNMEVFSLHEIGQALGKSLTAEECFTLISAKIQRLLHFSECAIWVPESHGKVLRARFASGPAAPYIKDATLINPKGIPQSSEFTCWAGASYPRSAVVAPMMVDGVLVGVLALYDDIAHSYVSHEEQLVAMIARPIAAEVQLALLFEQKEDQTLTDAVTGLPNARYMAQAFSQEAARAKEQKSPLTLLLIEVDQQSADTEGLGPGVGDRSLAEMARAIRAQMRICDTCIRYEGGRFAALLPGAEGAEMEPLVERLKEVARDFGLEARPGRVIRFAFSFGSATLPGDGSGFEELMAVASGKLQADRERRRSAASSQVSSIDDDGGQRDTARRADRAH